MGNRNVNLQFYISEKYLLFQESELVKVNKQFGKNDLSPEINKEKAECQGRNSLKIQPKQKPKEGQGV